MHPKNAKCRLQRDKYTLKGWYNMLLSVNNDLLLQQDTFTLKFLIISLALYGLYSIIKKYFI